MNLDPPFFEMKAVSFIHFKSLLLRLGQTKVIELKSIAALFISEDIKFITKFMKGHVCSKRKYNAENNEKSTKHF